MYCRGSVDMTVEWVLNDIPIKKEEIVSYLIEAIPDKLKEYMEIIVILTNYFFWTICQYKNLLHIT